MEDSEFKLYVRNFLPETIFIQQYGNEVFEKIKTNTVNNGSCSACKHEPRNTDPNKALGLHIYKIDKENPINSKAIYLCKSCHSTQHILASLQNDWVKFVNSSLTQSTLISFSRYGNLKELYKKGQVFDLKKTPEEFLKEVQTGKFKTSTTLKVLFTNNFIFNDL